MDAVLARAPVPVVASLHALESVMIFWLATRLAQRAQQLT